MANPPDYPPASSAVYRNALTPGTQLQEYRIEAVLGVGGFGMTYLAQDTHLDKPVAIKEYFPAGVAVRGQDGGVLSNDTQGAAGYQWGLERFLQEARTLARFSHPHIVRVNRYFEANGTGYMVMDYENGESLHQNLAQAPQPVEARVKQLLYPLLDGLDAVHKTGFLHRDIKPANIFIRASGEPVLIDFGSARQAMGDTTKTLTSVLTPGYAPLEQYTGDNDQGPWTDIYALGGVLYRVFTGDNPPDAVSRLKSDPIPLKLKALTGRVSQPVLRATEWALAMDEKSRPQSVEAWRLALEGKTPVMLAAAPPAVAVAGGAAGAAGAAVPTVTLPVSPAAAPARKTSRPPAYKAEVAQGASIWRWLGMGALLILLAGGGHAWYKRKLDAERAAAEADAKANAARAQILEDKLHAVTAAPPVQPQPGNQSQLEQLAVTERELAVQEKELQLRKTEAELRASEERVRAAQKSDAAAPKSAQPAPAPVDTAALDAARRNDPMASTKEAGFRRQDANGDGYLSSDEVRDMPGVARDFQSIDSNRDGRISLEEFFNYRPATPPDGDGGGGAGGAPGGPGGAAPGGPGGGPPGRKGR